MARRCYKYVTVVNDEIVLLGKHYESVLVEWPDNMALRLILVEKRRFVRVSEVIGKPCATKDDLLEIAKKLLGDRDSDSPSS